MVGMNDLEHLPVLVEPTRHPALFTHRKLLFRRIGGAPEIGDRGHVARRILGQHAERAAPARLAMLARRQRDDDALANGGGIEIGHRAPLDEAFGKVVGKIAQPREAQLFERTQQLRPDTLECLHFLEQVIEPLGTHGCNLTRKQKCRHAELVSASMVPPLGSPVG